MMATRLVVRWILVCASLLVCLSTAGRSFAAESWTVGDYVVVSSVRVGRTDMEFTIRASITNGGASALGVTAKVTSTVAATVIVADSLTFGDVPAGTKVVSQDTFKLRQDRTLAFDPTKLVWAVASTPAVFAVTISTPAEGFLANSATVRVTGSTSRPATSVKVNGVAATLSGTAFTADIPVIEGGNTLTVAATDAGGAVATANVNVTRDTEPPRVAIDSPVADAVLGTSAVTVTGIVNDTVIGTVNSTQATVTVNGVAATVANRTFSAANIPLVVGANTLTARATDRAGNVATSSVNVSYASGAVAKVQVVSGDNQSGQIATLLPNPLVVLVTDQTGAPMVGKDVIFKVVQNDGVLTGGGRVARSVIVSTDPQGRAQVTFQLGTRVGAGNHQVQAMVVGIAVQALFRASATAALPALLVADSGTRQSGPPGQPLPKPFVAIIVDSGNNRLAGVPITFSVKTGGGHFGGATTKTVSTDSDGRALATLTLGDAEGIENNRVEATFSGNTRLPAVFVASALIPGPASATSISGVILDNSDVPVPGATITINGTTLSARSDDQGQFTIKPAPVGTVRMDVDGTTVTRPGSWVNLDFRLTTVSGRDNSIGMPIRLLPMDLSRAVAVGTNYGGTITLPDYPGFSMKLAPNSVTFPGGAKVGSVHATVVHNDKTPEVPNFGQQPRFIVSINPKRAIFNPPAQLCLPNLEGLPPGQKTEMYSYDPDLNSFVAIGTGTVSVDGTQICSDPGVGVVKGGWHCAGNPAVPGGGENVRVSLNRTEIILPYGGTSLIVATGSPSTGADPAYTWSSSNPTVATVSPASSNKQPSDAIVTSVGPGSTTVTVTYRCLSGGSASASATITVVKIEPDSVANADYIGSLGDELVYAASQGSGDVVFNIKANPSAQPPSGTIFWNGGSPGANQLQRIVSRQALIQTGTPIKAICGDSVVQFKLFVFRSGPTAGPVNYDVTVLRDDATTVFDATHPFGITVYGDAFRPASTYSIYYASGRWKFTLDRVGFTIRWGINDQGREDVPNPLANPFPRAPGLSAGTTESQKKAIAKYDLTPGVYNGIDGIAPRISYWSSELTTRHELYHVRDVKDVYFFPKVLEASENIAAYEIPVTLANLSPASVLTNTEGQLTAELLTRLTEANSLYRPGAEVRAYADGKPKYQQLSDAIAP